jgi:Nucleotidyltransferase of unknown function (DUF6036)
MSIGFSRDDITVLLDDLNGELRRRGARADLFLVGGAAIAVAYDSGRSTRDLDAVFLPTQVVRQAAQSVAERRGLVSDWSKSMPTTSRFSIGRWVSRRWTRVSTWWKACTRAGG